MNRQNDSVNPLLARRQAMGVSREGLADRAGVSLRTLERIELGESYPRRATRAVIAMALGCRSEDIWPADDLEPAA